MSSPYLNNLIIIGCILTYTSVILLGLDSEMTSEKHFRYVCTARAWVLMSGFTLAFGSMFSKTWRVHAIFTNIKLNKKVIKDYKLFMVVGVLVIVDIVILITWQIVDPFYRDTSTGEPTLSPKNDDVQIIPIMEFCQSNRMSIFLGSIYAYKGLLMAFGCFLAWETRHVSIPALNDSKYIGMSVYNVVIMCVMGAAVSYLLREHQDAAFVIISSFIIFCSTATLCLVFVPKVRLLFELWRNPHASHTRLRATLKPLKKSRRSSQDETIHCRLKLLQDDNRKYRKKLEETTLRLQKIMAKLKELEEPLIVISHGIQISSPIMEDSSSPCEDVIISYAETYSEEISKSSYLSTEMQFLEIKPEYQKRKISAHSVRFPILEVDEEPTVRAEKSCPELNHSPADMPSNKISLRPRSLLEEFSLIAKYADASSSSESPPTPRAHDDSDDSRMSRTNGEAEDNRYSRLVPPETIRRHSAELPHTTTSRVSVIQERHYVPHTVRKPYRSSRHLSQPSIKCDIVEYL